jgi:UDP-N-acetyl-2-amino-2-deoxyglucuronate dehydrogenase
MSVGVGILGSGYMGRKWANVAARIVAEAELAGVTGGRRADGLATDLGCRRYGTYEEMLEDPAVDVVVLATPPAGHAAQSVAAAQAGKHLLVEKPMANTVAQCREMIEACETADVRLAVVSPHRRKAGVLIAKQLVDAGAIGEVKMVRSLGLEMGFWDTTKTQDEWKLDPDQQSLYASWGAHACDLIRWFIGSEPDLAFAVFEQYATTPPPGSSAMASYHFENGAMAQIWTSYDIPSPGFGSPLQFFLVGTKGMLDVDSYGLIRLAGGEIELGGRSEWTTLYETPPVDPDNNPMYQLAAQLRDLFDAIRDHREPEVNGTEGLQTTGMLEAAEISARTGDSVRLPLS